MRSNAGSIFWLVPRACGAKIRQIPQCKSVLFTRRTAGSSGLRGSMCGCDKLWDLELGRLRSNDVFGTIGSAK
jgi:hypothetical protein